MNTAELKQEVEARVRAYREQALEHFGRTMPTISVRFTDKGTAAGNAKLFRDGSAIVTFSEPMLEHHGEEFMRETVPHEVAHIVAGVLARMDRKRIRPHGREWQAVMRTVFGVEPERTHSFDTSGCKVRRERKLPAFCECRQFTELGVRRLKRCIREGVRYRCPKCKTCIEPTFETKQLLRDEEWNR
jgi:SprT protein